MYSTIILCAQNFTNLKQISATIIDLFRLSAWFTTTPTQNST